MKYVLMVENVKTYETNNRAIINKLAARYMSQNKKIKILRKVLDKTI